MQNVNLERYMHVDVHIFSICVYKTLVILGCTVLSTAKLSPQLLDGCIFLFGSQDDLYICNPNGTFLQIKVHFSFP